MKHLALALAFFLELVAFVGFACLGYLLDVTSIYKIIMFIILFVLVISFWSVYMAPRAPHKLSGAHYYLCKSAIYLVAAVSIYGIKTPALSASFLIAFAIDELVIYQTSEKH
jgi:hypothetical protein